MIIKKTYNFFIQLIINNLIKFFSQYIKKKNNYWIFSMDGGKNLNGNVLYFLKYILKNYKNIRVICFLDKQKRGDLNKKNVIFCEVNSIKSFYYAIVSKVLICSYDMALDHINFDTNKTIKVNLWHGGGIKKIQYLDKKISYSLSNPSLRQKIKNKLFGYVKPEDYDFIGYKAKIFKEVMINAFNNKNVFLNGNPRDDYFYEKIDRNEIFERNKINNLKEKKIIAYLPTFRENSKNDILQLITKKTHLDYLRDNNIVIIHKLHPYRNDNSLVHNELIYHSRDFETQDLLNISDILITDYSGIYFDFLHLMRPIIFYPFDYKEYVNNEREFWFNDYFDDAFTPGPKCNDEKELFRSIVDYVEKPNKDHKLRLEALNKFQDYRDGKNCSRTYNFINSMLEKHET
jgi:CDP-glycerol glycerophosphotransferase (TagB/SpsB family)